MESLLRDWSILLPPTSTPLSGVDFFRRFPCGDTEKLKQSIRTFFFLRDLSLKLTNEEETQLPLTKQEHLVKENDALDLSKKLSSLAYSEMFLIYFLANFFYIFKR